MPKPPEAIHTRAASSSKPKTRKSIRIDNPFTITDSEWHRIFVNRAKNLLRTHEHDWKFLATAESDVFQQSRSTQTPEILLVPIVQVLVFQVVMLKFFPTTRRPSMEGIEFITSRIDTLWIASKSCGSNDSTDMIVSTKLELEEKLQQVFDADDIQGQENPLNILLPAYETMWRIVLRIFLEVRFRCMDEDRLTSTRLFKSFHESPIGKFEEPTLKLSSGPMLIRILVGALLLEIDGDFELIGDKTGEVLSGMPLENGRGAYAGPRLKVKEA
jgi:hypothetical protein